MSSINPSNLWVFPTLSLSFDSFVVTSIRLDSYGNRSLALQSENLKRWRTFNRFQNIIFGQYAGGDLENKNCNFADLVLD